MDNIITHPSRAQERQRIRPFTDPLRAMNAVLTATGCKPVLRAIIGAMVGIVGENYNEWTEIDDLTLAHASGAWAGSDDTARKWTQRTRKELIQWTEQTKLSLIICEPGGRTIEGNLFRSRYQMPIIDLSMKIAGVAPRGQEVNRHRAFVNATAKVLGEFKQAPQPNFQPKRRILDPNEVGENFVKIMRRSADQKRQGVVEGMQPQLAEKIVKLVDELKKREAV